MAKKSASTAGNRSSWLDEKNETPLIDDYARELGSFMEALADGKIDSKEMKNQEKRLVALLKSVEPKLDDELHADVTKLLCEVSAYSVMQVLHELGAARPRTKFRG